MLSHCGVQVAGEELSRQGRIYSQIDNSVRCQLIQTVSYIEDT